MAKKAPGKGHRKGMTIVDLMDMFPTEEAATECAAPFMDNPANLDDHLAGRATLPQMRIGPHPRGQPREDALLVHGLPLLFQREDGHRHAAVENPAALWAIAIYLCLTSLKSVSSMKLQRDIGVSQPTAWFMLHRIREAWAEDDDDQFDGPVEVDESYFGGERRNMSLSKRSSRIHLPGDEQEPWPAVGKTAVVGVKDRDSNEVRAEVVRRTDGATLQGFVDPRTHRVAGATVYPNR